MFLLIHFFALTIIHIETSTNVCSVAVSCNGAVIFDISNNEGLNHAAMLSPFVQQALEKIKELNLKPDAVAVSGGPGSYTGLRIGVSTAKGLCFGFGIPLIAVDTLRIICEDALTKFAIEKDAVLCPMIDARRMEVYTALYNSDLEEIKQVSAEIINEDSFLDILESKKMYFFGNGADKCKSVITHPNALFISDVEPLAKNMMRQAEQKFSAGEFADTAYFEPFYLKEFQATTPKKMI